MPEDVRSRPALVRSWAWGCVDWVAVLEVVVVGLVRSRAWGCVDWVAGLGGGGVSGWFGTESGLGLC